MYDDQFSISVTGTRDNLAADIEALHNAAFPATDVAALATTQPPVKEYRLGNVTFRASIVTQVQVVNHPAPKTRFGFGYPDIGGFKGREKESVTVHLEYYLFPDSEKTTTTIRRDLKKYTSL